MERSFFQRVVEEKILEAQRAGAFDDLPGKGKPLQFDDQSWVPEDLRVAYHVLKNARVLPPEAELLKEIHTLEDLLKYVADEDERKVLAQSIQWKIIHLDILKRGSFSLETVRHYGAKLARRFSRR
ncbi:MAG TPA: DnaJ family domain-containing protein [Candidatus Binatia bacterium]